MLGGPSALTSRTAVVGGGAREATTRADGAASECTPRQAGWVALGTLAQAFYEHVTAPRTARGTSGCGRSRCSTRNVQAGEMLDTGVIVARAHVEPDAMNSPLFARLTGSGRLVAQNLFKASRPPPPTYGPAEMPPRFAASQPGRNVPMPSRPPSPPRVDGDDGARPQSAVVRADAGGASSGGGGGGRVRRRRRRQTKLQTPRRAVRPPRRRRKGPRGEPDYYYGGLVAAAYTPAADVVGCHRTLQS